MDFKQALKSVSINSIFDVYCVTARTANRLLGGNPSTLDGALAMVDARVRRGELSPAIAEQLREKLRERYAPDDDGVVADEAVADAQAEAVEANRNIFIATEHGICVESRQLKAGLRECFSVQGIFMQRRGSRQPFQHAFFVRGAGPRDDADNVHFYGQNPLETPTGDLTAVPEADGTVQRVGHITGPAGPRSIVTLNDYVEAGRYFQFDILLNDYADRLDYRCVLQGLALLQDDGLGATRSQGFGRVEMLDISKVAARDVPALTNTTSKPTKIKPKKPEKKD